MYIHLHTHVITINDKEGHEFERKWEAVYMRGFGERKEKRAMM